MVKERPNYPDEGLIQFAKLLKKVSEHNGWSYREICKRSGTSPSGMISWLQNLERSHDDIWPGPGVQNIVSLAPLIRNPFTGKAFRAGDLLSVCVMEIVIPEELLESESFSIVHMGRPSNWDGPKPEGMKDDPYEDLHKSPTYIEMASHYWHTKIEPYLDVLLEEVGDEQADGSVTFASREYTYVRYPEGYIEVTPKDGRSTLSPENMIERDWKVMKYLAEKVKNKLGEPKNTQSLGQDTVDQIPMLKF